MTRKDHLVIAQELRAELGIRATTDYQEKSGLTEQQAIELTRKFMPKDLINCKYGRCDRVPCLSRCSETYWSDHGRITKMLMEKFAIVANEDIELYGTTGLIHDIDYLRYPHDRNHLIGRHPIPLVTRMMRDNANPNMCIAILEHAPYLGLANSSKLSLALTGCEELATLLSFKNSDKLSLLSDFATELAEGVSVSRYVNEKIDGTPRVFKSPESSVNVPLRKALAIQ